jgi:hypothetical protein
MLLRPWPLLCCLLPALFSCSGAAAAWELKYSKDGITVYERPVANERVSELKAIAEIDAPPLSCWNVIRDFERYTETMPFVMESRILQVTPPRSFVYLRVNVGIPGVWERDYTIEFTDQSDPPGPQRSYRAAWRLANDAGPVESDGTVRIALNQGTWEIAPSAEGRGATATYQVLVDPGGDLPAGLVRWGNANGIPKLFAAIRNATKTPRYQTD